jgi:hypothetical protein
VVPSFTALGPANEMHDVSGVSLQTVDALCGSLSFEAEQSFSSNRAEATIKDRAKTRRRPAFSKSP